MQNTFKSKIILSLFLIISTILMIIGPMVSSKFFSNTFEKKVNVDYNTKLSTGVNNKIKD